MNKHGLKFYFSNSRTIDQRAALKNVINTGEEVETIQGWFGFKGAEAKRSGCRQQDILPIGRIAQKEEVSKRLIETSDLDFLRKSNPKSTVA